MASNPLLWKSRQQFSEFSCKLQHSCNFLQSKEPCQVPHSLCFFQMLLWVSQMVLGTYGCAAAFPIIFFQWNVLILSSRILLQLIFITIFYLKFHSEMKGCVTWNFRILYKIERVNLDQVNIGIWRDLDLFWLLQLSAYRISLASPRKTLRILMLPYSVSYSFNLVPHLRHFTNYSNITITGQKYYI